MEFKMLDPEIVNLVGDELVAAKHANSIMDHISNVQEAGRSLGVPEEQLAVHDESKWSLEEFPGYALNFHGNDSHDKYADTPSFAHAWLHHIHHNPHHWQHWIFPDGYTAAGMENGVLRMPENYALEMVADWMGASKSYQGSWDMKDWLWKHIPKIHLHSMTAEYVGEVLVSLGYREIIQKRLFAGGKSNDHRT